MVDNGYDHLNQKKDRMFLVRVGTPISEIDPDELPSPRGEGDRKLSNRVRKIMPRRPYEDKNLREILDMLYRNRKFVIILILIYQKGPTFYVKKNYNGPKIQSIDELKNNEILKKARISKNANAGSITINHLSAIRIENNFKEIE